jgi:hypothetical protein
MASKLVHLMGDEPREGTTYPKTGRSIQFESQQVELWAR